MQRPSWLRAVSRVLAGLTLAASLQIVQSGVVVAQTLPSEPNATDAAQRGSKLEALFAALKSAANDDESREFVDEIWRIWNASGNADVDALMTQASKAMGFRDFGLAGRLLDEVVRQAPDFAEGWNRRATLRYLAGDHPGSLADIEKVLALEPRHFGAMAGRGLIQFAAEQWKDALAAFRKALVLNPFLNERHQLIPMLETLVEGEKL